MRTVTRIGVPPGVLLNPQQEHRYTKERLASVFASPPAVFHAWRLERHSLYQTREKAGQGRRLGDYRCRSSEEGVAQRSRELAKMPAAMVDATTANLDAMLAVSEVQGDGLLLLLFLGDRDTKLGGSWCPDCVRAEPAIYKTLESSNKHMTLLRVYVGDRTTWRKSSHPLRADPRFLLKGVPTLIRWEDGKITGRLEDHEAHVEDKIEKLIS